MKLKLRLCAFSNVIPILNLKIVDNAKQAGITFALTHMKKKTQQIIVLSVVEKWSGSN